MKRIFTALFALMCISIAMPVMAQVSITKVDKIAPDDMVWMDMAVEAAKTNVKQGGEASGAVIILNGAFRCQGRAMLRVLLNPTHSSNLALTVSKTQRFTR